jgi:cytochrome b561
VLRPQPVCIERWASRRKLETISTMTTAQQITRRDAHYGVTARRFHWLTVGLLLIIVPLGLTMGDLPRGQLQDTLFITHESLGLTVLALTLARLMWRLTHPPPRPSADLQPIEKRASGSVHALLYVVLILMPATGYLFVVYRGIELSYFGLTDVPALVEPDKAMGRLAGLAHGLLQWAVYALVFLHVTAALHHYFVRKNDVLARMLPRLNRPPLRAR